MYRLSLGIICKNERHNLPTLLESVRDCVDAVFITDTGSGDGTREMLAEWEKGPNPANCPLFVSDFQWVHDFAAARNFNLEQLRGKSDYYFWLDADDSLVNPEAFREWRDHLMTIADQWLSTYDYGDAGDGRNRCMFARERIFRLSHGFEWRYPIHEGVTSTNPTPPITLYAPAWHVKHRRSEVDAAADRSRNLGVFEKLLAAGKPLDARMRFYYGKELFENRRPMEAFPVLLDAAGDPDTQIHDRILAYQYACLAAADCNQPERAIHLAHLGLQLAPTRAEFHVIIGDSYLRQGKLAEAVPHYAAAKSCEAPPIEARIQSAIFQHRDAYTFHPRLQLAKCLAQLGRFNEARVEVEAAATLGEHPEILPLLAEITRVQGLLAQAERGDGIERKVTDEIVVTCLPGSFYEWDESSLESRGIGGSESAVVYLSRELGKMGIPVRVFGNVPFTKVFGNVTYHPATEAASYLSKHYPKAHIAWRHATKLTPAPTYVWCHDLSCPGIEEHGNYDAVLALSDFHRQWLRFMHQVPDAKIRVVSNAIDRDLWASARSEAELGPERRPVVVWSSSPDRGLLKALAIMDEVVKAEPEAELHVFYGFENMRKNNAGPLADRMIAECEKRPYVKLRGNLTKAEHAKALLGAKVWLYPTDFLETYCITAMEAYAAGLHVICRDFGALRERVAGLPAIIIPGSPNLPQVEKLYVEATVAALGYETDPVPLEKLKSWNDVANEWLTWLPLRK